MEIKEICPTTTQEWIKNGAILVDVREQHEVDELAYSAPRLVHIPLSEFEERFQELPTEQDLVMLCRSGARSLRATNFLLNNGYTRTVNMQHGLIRWVEKGFPTVGDTSKFVKLDSADCCSTSSCC